MGTDIGEKDETLYCSVAKCDNILFLHKLHSLLFLNHVEISSYWLSPCPEKLSVFMENCHSFKVHHLKIKL